MYALNCLVHIPSYGLESGMTDACLAIATTVQSASKPCQLIQSAVVVDAIALLGLWVEHQTPA
jgi:hypothetical protein